MQITASQTFLDGRDRYEEGETYEVDDAAAVYFIGNGWATGPDGYTGPGGNQAETLPLAEDTVTLEVHDSGHGHDSQVEG